jgi:hypothetical protein
MLRKTVLRPLSLAALGAIALSAATAASAADQPVPPPAGYAEQPAPTASPATGETARLPVPTIDSDEDNTRSVRVIDEKSFPPALPVAPPPVMATPDPAAPDPQTFEIGKASLKADNAAGLSIDILPGQQLQVGTKIAFKITTKRAGYLLLVDVDATGKLTQIYPNQRSLMGGKAREGANRIRPGRTVTIPDPGDPLAGFEYVAAPPNGVAMVVAILSDKPVQLIDLPDVPAQFAGQQAALKYLTDFARTLKIADNDSSALEDTKWSFDAKLYVIR